MEHTGEQEPNFNMKVGGEAVLIRRRGGEGAILNSKGEFNRSYIPRFQVEEVPEGAAEERCKAKESTNRLLREQDGDWERRKLRELGTEAKLGPKTSLRLKHSLIEEGWWEPQTPKGAEQDSQTREPAVSGEQTGPQEESYTRSSTPAREQVLIQPSIAGFLNPAPSQGGPTRGKLVTSPDQNPTAGETLNCGSQCKIDDMPIDEQKGGEAFGETTEMRSLNLGGGNTTTHCMNEEQYDTAKYNYTDEGVLDGNDGMSSTTPSVRKICMGKPKTQYEMSTSMKSREPEKMALNVKNREGSSIMECEFKRGGRCRIHDCVGVKRTITKQVWAKKRDGGYGWASRKLTTYKCQYEGVARTDGSHLDLGLSKQTTSSLGGKSDNMKKGKSSRISREGLKGVEANKSESFGLENNDQDLE